jgi:hypothetical protein
MPIDQAFNAPWTRKHDLPGARLIAPGILYPTSLEDLIDICTNRPAGTRLKAAGSHWALSDAAISDDVFVETNDPNDAHPAMGRTLHEVVRKCLSAQFLDAMRVRIPPTFEDNIDDQTNYLVHVETGKRIYQLYAELDQDANDDPESLARALKDRHQNGHYAGPWAFRTLGGAGGQTVFGALTTGTHGGDFRFPPIADDVAALHLVAHGGRHYWIEPEVQPEEAQLTDDDRLMDLYGDDRYGGRDMFKILRNDDVFNAVLVSVGRFGIVYSIVLRAVRQYMLHEQRRLTNWQDVRALVGNRNSALYTVPNTNRFLQIAICLTPYSNFQKNLCGVTKRWNERFDPHTGSPNGRDERVGPVVQRATSERPWPVFKFAGNSIAYSPDEDDPNKAADPSFLERACSNGDFMMGVLESVCGEIRQFVDNNQVVAGSAIAAVAVTGGTAGLLALAAPLAAILALLLAFLAAMRAAGSGHRLGQVMNDIKDELLNRSDPAERAAGLLAWQLIAFKAFSSQQDDLDYAAISYAVMDRHDYHDLSCNVNVDSIEVFFDATDPMLIAFVDALLAYEIRQEFEGKAFVGYISLRFTAKTRALIGPERYRLSCAVEIAGLKDVTGVTELIDFAVAMSRNRNFGAILHWGQRNESDVADIELRFGDRNDPKGGDLGRWRQALAMITDGGRLDGFSSTFTRNTGLEAV